MSPPVDSSTLRWRKASGSSNHGACVEIAEAPYGVAVRDSKRPEGTVLKYSRQAIDRFFRRIKEGDF